MLFLIRGQRGSQVNATSGYSAMSCLGTAEYAAMSSIHSPPLRQELVCRFARESQCGELRLSSELPQARIAVEHVHRPLAVEKARQR